MPPRRRWRHDTASLAGLLAIALLAGCSAPQPTAPAQPAPTAAVPIPFADLPGWKTDHVGDALPALLKSCAHADAAAVGQSFEGVAPASAWTSMCQAARAVPPHDDLAFRRFLEARFQPYAIDPEPQRQGLLTGYFEPEFQGARRPDAVMRTPVYGRPADLVDVDLGQFSPDLAGQRIVGRVKDGRLLPYWSRAEIDAGDMGGTAPVLLYLASPVDLFFLQIQGSGRIRLRDGGAVRVGFAARNGLPYLAIGKVLVQQGDLRRDEVSMQTIRDWLERHPQKARAVMEENRSYIFFRIVSGLSADDGPPGALGAPLTPGRSIAVDRTVIPLGVPMFVDTTDPIDGAPLQRLMLAQDTGSAITGKMRGDIFFGWGAEAEARAGRMAQPGRLYVLLPRQEPLQ